MNRLIIESPYAGDIDRNVEFARNVCEYAVRKGYAPFASHLLYTQFLDDDVKRERDMGIEAGFTWGEAADVVWVCTRPGEQPSRGMNRGVEKHKKNGVDVIRKTFTQDGTPITEEETPDAVG